MSDNGGAMQRPCVVLEAPRGAIVLASMEAPDPGPGEVWIRMEACGICHSDLFVAGLEKLPLVPLTLGHEGIGRVAAAGEGVTDLKIGDRVGMTFLGATCGSCDLCRSGLERYCAKQLNFGYTLHGGMTGLAVARAQHLIRVPDGLAAAEAAPLCCAGWTAYGAIREAGLGAGQLLAIFGMGGLGHLAVQYARRAGLRVAVADVSEEKLAQGRALGADFTVSGESAGRTIQKEAGGADAAIVFTGSPAAIQQAFRSVKRTGTVVLVGLSTNQYELPIVDTVLKGIRIRGSYLGTRDDLAEVLRMGALGQVKARVETHEVEAAPELLERLKSGRLLGRAVVVF